MTFTDWWIIIFGTLIAIGFGVIIVMMAIWLWKSLKESIRERKNRAMNNRLEDMFISLARRYVDERISSRGKTGEHLSITIKVGETTVGEKVIYHNIPSLFDIDDTKIFVERIFFALREEEKI